jgi:hypothetical protein
MKILYRVLIAFSFIATPSAVIAKEPPHIKSMMGQVQLQGLGRLNFWGFHVYDANLYRGINKDSQEFALELKYQRSFTGEAIANRTADEMKGLGVPASQALAWGKELAAVLPNVEPGQTLAAVYTPKQGTTFFFEGKRIAQFQSVEFSKAFFAIWLDPKTSAPKLRTELLGQGCTPTLISGAC